MHDPDAPTGGIGWTHWVVANIPAKVDRLPAGISVGDTKLPAGALQTRTDAGKPGYMGACPPTGRAQSLRDHADRPEGGRAAGA